MLRESYVLSLEVIKSGRVKAAIIPHAALPPPIKRGKHRLMFPGRRSIVLGTDLPLFHVEHCAAEQCPQTRIDLQRRNKKLTFVGFEYVDQASLELRPEFGGEVIDQQYRGRTTFDPDQFGLCQYQCRDQHLLLSAAHMIANAMFTEANPKFGAMRTFDGLPHSPVTIAASVQGLCVAELPTPPLLELDRPPLNAEQASYVVVQYWPQTLEVRVAQLGDLHGGVDEVIVPSAHQPVAGALSQGLVSLSQCAFVGPPHIQESMFHVEHTPIQVSPTIARSVFQ